MTTKQIVLALRPKGLPTLANFKTENIDLPQVKAGEVLLQGTCFSVDPYMRGRMNEAKSYIPAFEIGKPLAGIVIAKVLQSKSGSFKIADVVVGMLPWQKEMIADEKNLKVIDTTIAPASYYLGILGITGLTAYFGLMQIGKPKAGETVVVSGAAGGVGMVVGQIAKIQGCHVLGIAGTDEKIKLLRDQFGFDEAINYRKTTDMQKAIAIACPNGVDIYFDNVGGKTSDAIIANINFHARIPLCGQISLYNSTKTQMGPRLQPMLLTRSVMMQGFIIGDFKDQFPEGIKQLAQWLKDGKLKFAETIEHGFERLPTALLGLFNGKNTGKMIVEA
jgi:NADPH:quinone reductase